MMHYFAGFHVFSDGSLDRNSVPMWVSKTTKEKSRFVNMTEITEEEALRWVEIAKERIENPQSWQDSLGKWLYPTEIEDEEAEEAEV